MRSIYISVLISLCGIGAFGQQTVQFSQYVFNGLAVNPGYAGYKEEWNANISLRSQWVGVDGAPQTGVASVDGLTANPNKKVGLGLIVTGDQLGPQRMFSAYANYAYRLQLDYDDTKRLSFGLGFGATQYNLDGSMFNYFDEQDQAIPAGFASKLVPDFRFGVYYSSPTFYIGASVLDLLAGREGSSARVDNYSVVRQVRHIYLTAGAMFELSEGVSIKPSFMLKEDFRGPTNLDVTAFLAFDKKLWFGAGYRTGAYIYKKNNLQEGLDRSDAVSGIAQFYVNGNLRIGYSYDYTLNQLSSYQNGSHEISIGLTLPSRQPRVYNPRYF